MSPRNCRCFRAILLATFATALLSSGCASLDLGSLGFGSEPPPKSMIGPETPTFFVELHGATTKPRRVTMPLTKPTLVSEVFEKVNANGQPFTRYKAFIVRKAENGVLRLPVHWENGRTGAVSHAQNYAVHPNDRVLIVENTNTYVDDMIENVMEPLGFMRKR